MKIFDLLVKYIFVFEIMEEEKVFFYKRVVVCVVFCI